MEFDVAGDLYFTPKDTFCEIDLSSSSFLDEFPDGQSKKLLLKKIGDAYYLSIREKNVGDTGKDYWFVVKFEYNNAALAITKTSVKDSTFSKNLEQYNKIASIKTIGSSQYLCTASDQQFFSLFEEQGLFEREVWESVGTEQTQVMWYVVGVVVIGVD